MTLSLPQRSKFCDVCHERTWCVITIGAYRALYRCLLCWEHAKGAR